MNILKYNIISTVLIFVFVNMSHSQDIYVKYYVKLSDKENNEYTVHNPDDFLSSRAIQRRVNQGIDIDIRDLPVSQFYIDSIENIGATIINTSKWLNTITIQLSDTTLTELILGISFVDSIIKISEHNNTENKEQKFGKIQTYHSYNKKLKIRDNYYDYGSSSDQIMIHNGHKLHNSGYRGQGILIAVTDSGFEELESLSSFDSLLNDNRILYTRDFVNQTENVFHYHNHGTWVLSVLAANHASYLIGSAPEADYMLLITEDYATETIIEELNWLSAAEFADSAGADIINVSLGYLGFDDPQFNYTYEDMDGQTSIISQGAKIAFEKGMIVVAAAGNSGENQDHPFIVTPGDGINTITVGAINPELEIAPFSSIGPSFDGRVKPDVVAVGRQTVVQNTNGSFISGNGTSFATPIIAGLTACLWQKFPEKSNLDIINKIRQSSHIFNNPDNVFGYGIPDFDYASTLLKTQQTIFSKNNIYVYPNPFINEIKIDFNNIDKDLKDNTLIQVTISDLSGRVYYNSIYNSINSSLRITSLDKLSKGVYILRLDFDDKYLTTKLIKF